MGVNALGVAGVRADFQKVFENGLDNRFVRQHQERLVVSLQKLRVEHVFVGQNPKCPRLL